MSTLKEEAEGLLNKMIEIRRTLHMNPELGFEEFETANLIKSKLDEIGIPYKSEIAKTGIVATIQGTGNGNGKRIMIRADMDALPLQEDVDKPYKSQVPGKMHACGHDTHVACLLGAGEILNNNKDKFGGTIDLLFQPAEEGPGGAVPMIKEGAIGDPENPHIDAALALHITGNYPVKLMAVKDGPLTGSSDEFTIIIHGKGGHASAPHTTIDPVFVATQIYQNLQSFLTRYISPIEPRVFTVGKIEGGTRFNIIPTKCTMYATLRTLNEKLREELHEVIPNFIKKIAEANGATADVSIFKKYAVGVNSKDVNEHIRAAIKSTFGEESLEELDTPILGAEDFFEFSLKGKIPVAMFWLGGANEKKGIIAPNHSNFFDVDEDAFVYGAATLAQAAINYLNS
ncbi:MAG: M20 family metallopeptidase [Candidatus Heimdallarchaeota archaeon]|nr:M20 family metallopeptidase [Candidatus Heimdallarchaeota archaeon]MDH5645912.1 M20 family metallopeptidase [Candidatus Heimdallarchaeota archaeon]